MVEQGKQYYVFAELIEAYSRDQSDEGWDTGGSAPDLYYQVWWNDNRIYESPERKDVLVGRWTGLKVPFTFVENVLLNESASLEGFVDAASFTADERCVLEFRVWDDDATSDDSVGVQTVECETLKLGTNTFEYHPSKVNALKRLDLRVAPMDLPPAELLTMLAAKKQ